MTVPSSAWKRAAAVAGVAALTTTSLLTAAGSANAASTSLQYTCATPFGNFDFNASGDTSLPATLAYGQTVSAAKAAAKVSVPADLHGAAYGILGARSVTGKGTVNLTVAGTKTPVAATMPQTPVTGQGALDIPANGTFSYRAMKMGAQKVAVTTFSATMVFAKEDGSEAGVISAECSPKADVTQDFTVDKFTVVKAASVQSLTAKYTKARKTISGTDTVKGKYGTGATGKVTFTLRRGTTKVGAQTKTLSGGKASYSFGKVRKAGKYSVTAVYGGSSTLNKSTAKRALTVR